MSHRSYFSFQSYSHLPVYKQLLFWIADNLIRIILPKKDVILPFRSMRILVVNPSNNLLGRSIYLRGVWEKQATDCISKKIKSGMTVLDIGANTGYYTVLFAGLVGPNGRVFSFEPIPRAKKYLDENIRLNNFNQVRSYEFALFDSAGTVCLEDPFHNDKINPNKNILSKDDISVEMKVYDKWESSEKVGGIDIVKLDVEGAELNVLKGMKRNLVKYHPGILVEVHPEQMKSFGYNTHDLIDFLSDLNYKFEPVGKSKMDFSKGTVTVYCE